MINKSNSQAQVNIAIPTTSSHHEHHQSYVPFLIKSNRFKQSKNHSPPIGSYNVSSCFSKKSSPLQNKISHFILEAQKAKQQMSVFKSTKHRFQKVQNCVPSPAFYNLYNKSPLIKQQKLKKYQNKQNINKTNSRPKVCPSIPDKNHKYGYSLNTNGQHKKIQKSNEQLQKQKQARKQYLQGLVEQKSSLFKRQSINKDNYQSDIKKKLYQTSSKFIPRSHTEQYIQTSQHVQHHNKKPKYEHLYHSKGVLISNNHRYIGPGQYDIDNRTFNLVEKTERHQFFGSTQVRFPQKLCQEEKGYSLLEMIKQNRRQDLIHAKIPSKQTFVGYKTKKVQIIKEYPGPGDYNPDDMCLKKSRGTAVFPLQKRFKQQKISNPSSNVSFLNKSKLKKQMNFGHLKKQKIKSIHTSYQPVSSDQIYGVLSEGIQAGKYKQKYQKIYKDLGKMGQNQDITCWNYDEKQGKNDHIKYLKNELAFISSPREQQIVDTNKQK